MNADQAPVERDLSEFLYESIDASSFVNVKEWSKFYDQIPVDPYVPEGYRYKSVVWVRVKHDRAPANRGIDERIVAVNTLSGMNERQSQAYKSSAPASWRSPETGYSGWILPQYAMQQSIQYNPVHGDMRREYPAIDRLITEGEDFRRLLVHYATYFGWGDAIVLVQFQRVDCLANRLGKPAVEGFHQDGNRYVGMLIVNRQNLTADSGVSQYAMDDGGKKGDRLVFNEAIPPGRLIYWNDKRLWHYGTELTVADPRAQGGRGFRDIVILSAKTPPANMPMGPVPSAFRTWERAC
jgi:hypothetical protein